MVAIAPINLNLARLNSTQKKTLADLQYKIDHHVKLTPAEQTAYDKFLKLAMAAVTQPAPSDGGSSGGCNGTSLSTQNTSDPAVDAPADQGTNPEDPNKPAPVKPHHTHKGNKNHDTTTPAATAASKSA